MQRIHFTTGYIYTLYVIVYVTNKNVLHILFYFIAHSTPYFIFYLFFSYFFILLLPIFIYILLCYVSFFILFFCTVHWADLSWPTFHYWLYPVWLCMWQIIKNLEPWPWYYKNMKVFFELECMSTCCWGLPKPKYEPFITHNRGTLKWQIHWTRDPIEARVEYIHEALNFSKRYTNKWLLGSFLLIPDLDYNLFYK